MNVFIGINPPQATQKHRSYSDLIESLRANRDWVAVAANEVSGSTKAQKQTTIHAACSRAGLKVETRTTDTQVFIRILNSSEVL
jgi:sulfur carrier protein ThiS